MKTVFRSLAFALVLVAMPAFAFQCPKDMKAVDDAMKTAKLSKEQMAEVKKLRADGEALHKAGKHDESVKTLGKAKELLGIKM